MNLRDYNCGGYALGTNDWFIPYNPREGNVYYKFSEYKENLDNFVKFMLEIFENVREIPNIKEAKLGERVIAFRCGYGDFHFVKVGKTTGRFRHKMGGSFIDEMEDIDFYDKDGWCCGRYDSEIKYLAIKGKKAQYNEKGREIFL